MVIHKAFKVVILASAVTFLVTGCSSSDSSPRVLPQVDGLNLLNPEFNTSLVEQAVQRGDVEQKSLQEKRTAATQNIELIASEIKTLDANREELIGQKALLVAELEALNTSGRTFHKSISVNKTDKVLEQKIAQVSAANRSKKLELIALEEELNELGFIARNFTDKEKVLKNKIAVIKAERKTLVDQWLSLYDEKNKLAASREAIVEDSRQKRAELTKQHEQSLAILNEKISQIDRQITNEDKQKEDLTKKIAQIESSIVQSENTELQPNQQLQIEFQKLKLKIMNQYKQNKNVSSADITEALLIKHFYTTTQGKLTFEEMKSQLQSIAQKIPTTDIMGLKSEYENIISADLHKNAKLVYNRDAISILDPLLNNKIQCYSGTLLFLVLNELLAQTYDHTVVIFTRGHVLPGFIQFNKLGQMNLYGIETTADGRAVIDYGKTSSISGEIRVLDAQQFMMVELFKNEINDFQGLYGEMLKTMALYGFSTDEFKALELSASFGKTDDILNASLLGFGRSNVAAGDIVRSTFDTQLNTMFQKVETPITTVAAAPEGAIEGSPIEWAKTAEKRCEELYSAFYFYQTAEETKYRFYQYYCSDLGKNEHCENYNESKDYQVALLSRWLEKKCLRDNRDSELISLKDYVATKGGRYYIVPPPPSELKFGDKTLVEE